jgi:hypothetical protein
MEEQNPNDMSNEDLEKDVNSNDIEKSDAAQNHSTATEGFIPDEEKVVPEVEEFDPSKEQDLDELVHQPEPEHKGTLPDPETTSLDEDDEYDRGKIANK